MTAPTLALPPGGRSQPRNTPTFGALVLVVAGAMAVGTLSAVFMALSFRAHQPPSGVRLDEYPAVVAGLTLILSSVTITWALYGLRLGERRQAMAALTATLLFGLADVSLVWFILAQAGFGVASSPFATLFYALVGTGGLLVAMGLVMVAGCIGKVAGNQLNAFEGEGLRAVLWYWHFAVGAWIVISLTIYPVVKL
ncbi:MAG TPA: cytochrome c oxidase subunit 3 [Acidimicrobiales bacterium]